MGDHTPENQPRRWDWTPLEESYDAARALTVSIADRMMRDGWVSLARHAGITARRWRRHHPLGDRQLVALVDGRPAFDGAAWERFVSLVPGASALPTRTADAFGVDRSSIAPPDRRVWAFDLVGARRRRHQLRRAERTIDAELARDAARIANLVDASFAPGDDGTTLSDLPQYALAARIEQLLVGVAELQSSTLVDLLAADATSQLLRLLVDRGRTPDDALLETALLQSGGGIPVPEHLVALSSIAMAAGDERRRQLATWRHSAHGWSAMRSLLMESPPLRNLSEQDLLAMATPQADHAATTDPLPNDDAELAAAALRARSMTARRTQAAFDRSSIHATLRALIWTLAARLQESGAIQNTGRAFDFNLDELLRAARGASITIPPHTRVASAAADASAPPRRMHGDLVELHGIPASRGSATGRIVVVDDDPSKMLDVDDAILVCRMTDPGWMPLLLRCAGLVTERGGPLSHAAVIARELQLPTVVSVPGARSAASDAGHARVDGTSGVVTLDPPD